MGINEYFDGLNDELKRFCLEKDFVPTNANEFNDFVRSYCQLDRLQDFTVEIPRQLKIENKFTTSVLIAKNQPFYACLPSVWQTMTDVQKVQSITMMFNCVYKEVSPRLLKKPQLIFIDSNSASKSFGSYTDTSHKLYSSLRRILSAKNPVLLLGSIMHELTHAEQEKERKEIIKSLPKPNYNVLSLSSYQKHLLFMDTGRVKYSINSLYEHIMNNHEKINNLNPDDANLWIKLERENSKEWEMLKDLPYVCNQNEMSAENNNKKILNTVLNAYCKECCKSWPNISTALDTLINALKKDYGYEISYDQTENFAQMGYISNFTRDVNFTYGVIKYLLNIYRTKKVKKPFADNYQLLEDGYLSFVQSHYRQQNEQIK